MNRVEEKLRPKSVHKELIILNEKNAINFVDECSVEKIVILGIDAFVITSDSIQPVQEKGCDFTSEPYKNMDIDRYATAKAVIEKAGSKFFFEITCDD